MIERFGLCQIKALNLLFSKYNATPIIMAPTVYIYINMASESRRDSYVDIGEDEVEMREETNKRDRINTSFETVKDDENSPQHKKKECQ